MARIRLILSLLITTLVLDQITKEWARNFFATHPPLSFIGGIVNILHSENPGAFLSLGAGMSENLRFYVFTIGVAIFLLGAIVYVLRTKDLDRGSLIAITLMVGGGIGNLIDRAFRGTVTDFIHLGVGPIQTGVFNVADMAITGGTIFLFLTSFRKEGAKNHPGPDLRN